MIQHKIQHCNLIKICGVTVRSVPVTSKNPCKMLHKWILAFKTRDFLTKILAGQFLLNSNYAVTVQIKSPKFCAICQCGKYNTSTE